MDWLFIVFFTITTTLKTSIMRHIGRGAHALARAGSDFADAIHLCSQFAM